MLVKQRTRTVPQFAGYAGLVAMYGLLFARGLIVQVLEPYYYAIACGFPRIASIREVPCFVSGLAMSSNPLLSIGLCPLPDFIM